MIKKKQGAIIIFYYFFGRTFCKLTLFLFCSFYGHFFKFSNLSEKIGRKLNRVNENSIIIKFFYILNIKN